MITHNRRGNCWDYPPWEEREVCAEHDQPRGECLDCPPVPHVWGA